MTVCLCLAQRGSPDSSPAQRRKNEPDRPSHSGEAGGGTQGRVEERGRLSADEDNPLREQLSTYIKRIAELETRVEELTIRSEV